MHALSRSLPGLPQMVKRPKQPGHDGADPEIVNALIPRRRPVAGRSTCAVTLPSRCATFDSATQEVGARNSRSLPVAPDLDATRCRVPESSSMPQGTRIRPPVPTAEQSRAAPGRPNCTRARAGQNPSRQRTRGGQVDKAGPSSRSALAGGSLTSSAWFAAPQASRFSTKTGVHQGIPRGKDPRSTDAQADAPERRLGREPPVSTASVRPAPDIECFDARYVGCGVGPK
jgi:hypothetical protein